MSTSMPPNNYGFFAATVSSKKPFTFKPVADRVLRLSNVALSDEGPAADSKTPTVLKLSVRGKKFVVATLSAAQPDCRLELFFVDDAVAIEVSGPRSVDVLGYLSAVQPPDSHAASSSSQSKPKQSKASKDSDSFFPLDEFEAEEDDPMSGLPPGPHPGLGSRAAKADKKKAQANAAPESDEDELESAEDDQGSDDDSDDDFAAAFMDDDDDDDDGDDGEDQEDGDDEEVDSDEAESPAPQTGSKRPRPQPAHQQKKPNGDAVAKTPAKPSGQPTPAKKPKQTPAPAQPTPAKAAPTPKPNAPKTPAKPAATPAKPAQTPAGASPGKTVKCVDPDCKKLFPNEAAMQQHAASKHK